MATTTHVPTATSLHADLTELLTKTSPVDLRTTIAIVCAHLVVTNIKMPNRATSAQNGDAFMSKFQTLVTPLLRKRLFPTPLIGCGKC